MAWDDKDTILRALRYSAATKEASKADIDRALECLPDLSMRKTAWGHPQEFARLPRSDDQSRRHKSVPRSTSGKRGCAPNSTGRHQLIQQR
eukprot:572641-Alexandrium_andersonii.AAC.2